MSMDSLKEVELQYKMRFLVEKDLSFDVMDFFFSRMLSQIIEDAKEQISAKGYSHAYSWAKKYLKWFVGDGSLTSYKEQPALHTSRAWDIVIDRFVDECSKVPSKYDGYDGR